MTTPAQKLQYKQCISQEVYRRRKKDWLDGRNGYYYGAKSNVFTFMMGLALPCRSEPHVMSCSLLSGMAQKTFFSGYSVPRGHDTHLFLSIPSFSQAIKGHTVCDLKGHILVMVIEIWPPSIQRSDPRITWFNPQLLHGSPPPFSDITCCPHYRGFPSESNTHCAL